MNTLLLVTMLGLLVGIILQIAVITLEIGASHIFTDFDAFYVAGQFFWEGRMAEAYDVEIMSARQSEIAGQSIFMPWSYPPQFNLITAVLTLGERGISYAMFALSTGVLFLLVLRRLANGEMTFVLLTVFPGLAIAALCGQNGFLTASFIGLFCLWSIRHDTRAGLPLGMMVIKPHLALGLGLATLLKRQWRVVALSLGVVAISSAIASAILGFGIWAAFLDGASAAGGNMEEGHYPLFRMTSVYAAAFTAGASADLALAVHAAAAAVGVGSIVLAFSMGWPIARFLAVSLFASLSISPYNYDYDMPALAIALALLLPCIKQFALLHERILLILSGWLCTGWGWAIYIWFQEGTEYEARKWLSLGGVGFCVMWLVVWRILLRAHAHETGRRWPVRPGASILDHAWPRLRALRPRSGLPR